MRTLHNKIFGLIDKIFPKIQTSTQDPICFDKAMEYIFTSLQYSKLEIAIAKSYLNDIFLEQVDKIETVIMKKETEELEQKISLYLHKRNPDLKEEYYEYWTEKMSRLIQMALTDQSAKTTHDWESKKVVGVYPINNDWEFVLDDTPFAHFSRSTGQFWEDMSSESIEQSIWYGFGSDIVHSNIVCFIRSKHTQKMVARVMLRWCECNGTLNKVSWGIEPRMYAGSERNILNQLASFAGNSIDDIITDFGESPRIINHPEWVQNKQFNFTVLYNSDGSLLDTFQLYALLNNLINTKGYEMCENCITPYNYGGWSDMAEGEDRMIKYRKRIEDQFLKLK